MAGGNINDIRSPYPKGADSVELLVVPLADAAGATTWTLAQFTLPFSCKCLHAEWYAGVFTDADADYVFRVEDDTAVTTKKWVSVTTLGASYAAGSLVRRSLTVDKNVELYAGAIVSVVATGGDAGDLITGGVLFLWLCPTR